MQQYRCTRIQQQGGPCIHNNRRRIIFLLKQRRSIVNTTEKTLIFIAGAVMIVTGLTGIVSWSELTGTLYGFGNWFQYASAGHWWVILFVGLIFCFMPLISGPNNSKEVDQRLVRMAADLKKLKKLIGHHSLQDEVFSQQNTPINGSPEIAAIGNPDSDGYEWITTNDGRNWYRNQGSSDEWIEFSN